MQRQAWRTLGVVVLRTAAVLAASLAVPTVASACTATIGDFVWLDTNRNGVQDPGEPGIAGVEVQLRHTDNTLIRSVLTDAQGYYSFTGHDDPPMCEVPYVISVVTPGSLAPTAAGAGTSETDSDNPAGTLVVASDTDFDKFAENLTIDFGFVQPIECNAAIGDLVFLDANGDGIQNAGDSGLPNIVLTLSGTSLTATTGSGGRYAFRNLCPGTYTVCTDPLVGFTTSPANQGTDDAIDSDGVANGTAICANPVTLAGGQTDSTVDFGFQSNPVKGPGTGTPGFWKTHPEAWPVDTITIGGVAYTQAQALYWLGQPDGDKTITMFRALVSAKLNVLVGNEASCISSTISAADAWMAANGPVGALVKAKSAAWKAGEPLYRQLDAYNNGDLCAPHRD